MVQPLQTTQRLAADLSNKTEINRWFIQQNRDQPLIYPTKQRSTAGLSNKTKINRWFIQQNKRSTADLSNKTEINRWFIQQNRDQPLVYPTKQRSTAD